MGTVEDSITTPWVQYTIAKKVNGMYTFQIIIILCVEYKKKQLEMIFKSARLPEGS